MRHVLLTISFTLDIKLLPVLFLVINNIDVTIFIYKLSIFLIASLRQILRSGTTGSRERQSDFWKSYTNLYTQLVFIKRGNFTSSIYVPFQILSSLFHFSLHNHSDPSPFFPCSFYSDQESCGLIIILENEAWISTYSLEDVEY